MLARLASFIAMVFRGIRVLFAPSPRPMRRRAQPAVRGPEPAPPPTVPDAAAGEDASRSRAARVALVYYFQLDKNEPVPDLASMTATYAARRMAARGGDARHGPTP